ncbi:hypothetical protein C8R43DRAFT_1112618 [Mycena crocata]|nr:hypothetical protein C8R43DRAFT_1112618 [Mycena crocata]
MLWSILRPRTAWTFNLDRLPLTLDFWARPPYVATPPEFLLRVHSMNGRPSRGPARCLGRRRTAWTFYLLTPTFIDHTHITSITGWPSIFALRSKCLW